MPAPRPTAAEKRRRFNGCALVMGVWIEPGIVRARDGFGPADRVCFLPTAFDAYLERLDACRASCKLAADKEVLAASSGMGPLWLHTYPSDDNPALAELWYFVRARYTRAGREACAAAAAYSAYTGATVRVANVTGRRGAEGFVVERADVTSVRLLPDGAAACWGTWANFYL